MQQPLPKDQAIIPVDGQHWCNVFKTFLRRLVSVKRRRVSTRINLQNAARRMWTCVKPEHRLYRVKFWIVVINFHPLSTNFQTMEPFQICLNCNLSTFQFLVFGKDTWKLVVSPVKFFYFFFVFLFFIFIYFLSSVIFCPDVFLPTDYMSCLVFLWFKIYCQMRNLSDMAILMVMS